MKLINFQGLNCYHNCIVSIAASQGLDYASAFSRLWSETDFRYDSGRNVYLTKRMIAGFRGLGTELMMLNSGTVDERAQSLEQPGLGEPFIVGMDAFYIPWCQLYRIHHGPHYFIAEKTGDGAFKCWDPTYRREEENLSSKEILPHAFDISRMVPVTDHGCGQVQIRTDFRAVNSPQDIRAEAEAILRGHPLFCGQLTSWLETFSYPRGEEGLKPANYIDALTDNRYLYRYYLARQLLPYSAGQFLFSQEHFSRWTAVKNGLYKAALVTDRKAVMAEILPKLNDLLIVEMNLARCILELPVITPESQITVRTEK